VHVESDRELKLPVGMQIVGRRFDDAMVLRVGDAWERAVDWRSRYLP
jgi:Asp-tRNA(Asn)/Glu-tRNA(Gln) amidotransferase A subunit family amidase